MPLRAESADVASGRTPSSGDDLHLLGLGFASLAAITYALVVLGALVRANNAGLACPDWPLCFGQVIPEIDMRVGFEFGHRVLASLVSLGFVAGGIGVFRNTIARARVGGWIVAAGVLLAIQIVLGGLTVLELLASWTVTSHLLTGNAFALCVALISHRLLSHRSDIGGGSPALRLVLVLTAAVLILQIALGGLVSSTYSGLACPDWPSCDSGVWIPTWSGPQGLQVIHRLNAYLLALLIGSSLWIAHRENHPGLRRLLLIALGLVVGQIAVGVANVLWRLPVEVTGAHSALAAMLCLAIGMAVHDSIDDRRPAQA